MGVKALLESRWAKAGKMSGTDVGVVSSIEATIVLIRDDGVALTAKSRTAAPDVSHFLGRKFDTLVVTGTKSGDIGTEDILNVIIMVGNEQSDADDTVTVVSQDIMKPLPHINVPTPLAGLKLTFPVKTTSAGFISGETFSNGHSYSCLVALWVFA